MTYLATSFAPGAPAAGALTEALSPMSFLSEEELATFGTRRTLTPGMLLVRQFDPPGPMYLILSGTVRILHMGAGAQPRELARLGASNHVGEIGALLKVPRSASVEAVTTVVALELTTDELGTLLHSDPVFGQTLVRNLRERADSAPPMLLAALAHAGGE